LLNAIVPDRRMPWMFCEHECREVAGTGTAIHGLTFRNSHYGGTSGLVSRSAEAAAEHSEAQHRTVVSRRLRVACSPQVGAERSEAQRYSTAVGLLPEQVRDQPNLVL
jgi:hypothetical protein